MNQEKLVKRLAVGTMEVLAVVGLSVTTGILPEGVARAHDPSKHRAKAIYGEVVRASKDAVTITGKGGETTFTLAAETKVLRAGEEIDAGALKAGEKVAVFGTKLPGGKVAATEINLGEQSDEGVHSGHGAPHANAE